MNGKEHLQMEGAKAGHPRLLPIDNNKKAKVVNLAHETSKALGSGTGRVIPPEMSPGQPMGSHPTCGKSS